MKQKINYLGVLLAMFFMGIFCTACHIEDTDAAGGGLAIKAFFPTKVVAHQPMTINGSGFSDVYQIEFPGGAIVTDFETVNDNMIRLNAPTGIATEGGKIAVRTLDKVAESRQPLTLGHTQVSGFSLQPGESVTGGDLITVFGSDLEFINAVELLDADGQPQLVDHKDFYRKGTSSLIFRVPVKNIFEGTWVGYLRTYDGQKIALPELAYQPAADEGHYETVKTTIWKNDGSLGEISWSGDYRFAPESNSTGEECYTVPQDVWERLKTETFYVTVKGENPQIRVTSGWWSTTWTGNDIQPGNELLADNGDGTWTLTVTLAGDPLLDVLDAQHLLFTGGGYTVEELYFAEEVWIDGPGMQEVKVPVWKNDGSLGEISWSGDYRFAPESNSTGEECYTVPQDVWERLKTETFYVTVKGENPQIRVTSGWWSTTWTGNDIQPGNELLADNGDGTWTLTVSLAGDPLLDVLDDQHLLFTGSGYTVEEIYFIELTAAGGGKDVVFWQNDGSLGEISWGGDYRFSSEGKSTGEECYAIPQDIWDSVIMKGTFYLTATGSDWVQMRITTGWWSTTWTGDDITTGNERIVDNGDGTFTIEINFAGDPILDVLDDQHLLFTGGGYTPQKLFYKE